MNKRRLLLCLSLMVALLLPMSELKPTWADAGEGTRNKDDAEHPAIAEFKEATELLQHNRGDEALVHLANALRGFSSVHDGAGQASVLATLGDIYSRQGQYSRALEYYGKALQLFSAAGQVVNSNFVLARMGETEYLMGDADAASKTFQQINQDQPGNAPGTEIVAPASQVSSANQSGFPASILASSPDSRKQRPFTPAAIIALGSSCASTPNSSSSQNPNATPPSSPPFQGHSPLTPGGSGRMDLRVLDQNGNPVSGVQAKLVSKYPQGLPKGFICDCQKVTDVQGRALMDPLHIGQLTLTLKAPGFSPQAIQVSAQDLSQPVRVVLQKNGVAQLSQAASVANAAPSASEQAAKAAQSEAQCFEGFGFFLAYTRGELGAGRSDYALNNLESASAHYHNALAASAEGSSFGKLEEAAIVRAVSLSNLGDIAFRQGRYGDAITSYNQAIDDARRSRQLSLLWAAQRGIGYSRLAQAGQEKDPQTIARLKADALDNYREALRVIETLFSGSLRSDESRTELLASTKQVFDEASSALAEMALDDVQSSDGFLTGAAFTKASEAFSIAEAGRARSLLDLLSAGRIDIVQGVPPDLLQRKGENEARQRAIADELTGIHLGGATPAQSISKLDSELDQLVSDHEAIENEIRIASPQYSSLTRMQPLNLGEVLQRLIDDGTALVEYSLGTDRSYLWVVTTQGVKLYRLPSRSSVEQQAVELRKEIIPAGARRAIAGIDVVPAETQRGLGLSTAPVPGTPALFAARSYALYQTLLAPAAGVLKNKRLLIVADGALDYIPFEALVENEGGGDYASLSYLIKTNEIVYAPSASVIAAIRAREANKAPGDSILVVADPIFNSNDARAQAHTTSGTARTESTRGLALGSALKDIGASSSSSGYVLPRLPGTRVEAEQIAKTANASGKKADLLLDSDANRKNIEQATSQKNYRILHFATHGLLDAERPQFTGLALSMLLPEESDGFLRTQEVFNLKLGSPLVILSACETGLGKQIRGEGVIGLTRAFMYAGAPSVGVSLWPVADRSTAELMPDFYKRLLAPQSAPAAAALRGAQISMIEGKRFSAPFYWAPFILVGDWR